MGKLQYQTPVPGASPRAPPTSRLPSYPPAHSPAHLLGGAEGQRYLVELRDNPAVAHNELGQDFGVSSQGVELKAKALHKVPAVDTQCEPQGGETGAWA